MSTALELVQRYFDYSNQSDMTRIATLLSESSTYYSVNLGFFTGKTAIIAMQTAFHDQYQTLKWTIEHITEIKPDVVKVVFSFDGTLQDGSQQQRQGHEYILVYAAQIQHISVDR